MKLISLLSLNALVLVIIPKILSSQGLDLSIQKIPDSIRMNASQVVRFENIQLSISDLDHAKLNVHKMVTVLNESGKKALFFSELTDKYISLEDADFRLYDANGKLINKFKYHDLHTVGLAEGLMDDSKTYYLEIPSSTFPVTLESSYELRYKGLINYPGYDILEPEQGVEHSSYTAKVPIEIGLRYKAKNINLQPSITEDGKYKNFTWTVDNIAPIQYEKNSVSSEDCYPAVILAPYNFKLDDYEGNMESWANFGRFYGMLQKGMGSLPPERIQFFKNMVEGTTDIREKIRKTYDYLQNNFRYVSIQLGIGGFKPFPADLTDSRKYGDCKALSNYMQAVLNCLGIKSYQALINADFNREPVDPSFPCNEFNHVILCVPLPKDSVWLECTSRSTDFGVLGNFTENRNALLITEDGGILVPTPRSQMKENRFSSSSMVYLNTEGSAKTWTQFTTTGAYKQELIELADEKSDEQRNYAMETWNFKQPDSLGFARTNSNQVMLLTIRQEPENIAELKTSSKIFLAPRLYQLFPQKLPSAEKRQQDFYFNHPFEKSDTTLFFLPDGYILDAMPDNRSTKCKYGTYSCKYWLDEKRNAVYSTASIQWSQYKIPAADYPEVKKFFDDLNSDDLKRIILKKKN